MYTFLFQHNAAAVLLCQNPQEGYGLCHGYINTNPHPYPPIPALKTCMGWHTLGEHYSDLMKNIYNPSKWGFHYFELHNVRFLWRETLNYEGTKRIQSTNLAC